jgi:hypothetical protein
MRTKKMRTNFSTHKYSTHYFFLYLNQKTQNNEK